MDTDDKNYRAGRAAARRAIKLGVPRWTVVGSRTPNHHIDDQTGLPIIGLGNKSSEIDAFAKGANEEILKGISDGRVSTDFRRLLLSRKELEISFEDSFVGILSLEIPNIEHEGVFEARLRSERLRKMHGVPYDADQRNVFVELRNFNGELFRDFAIYEEPIEMALALNDQVLVCRTKRQYFSRDLNTSQILNSYPR